jgi:Domain of unknown function (DUF6457)
VTLDEWVAAAAAELGLGSIPVEDQRLVLDLAREVAHNVVRPGAPVSAYLVGLAVGRGVPLAEAIRALTVLAQQQGGAAR